MTKRKINFVRPQLKSDISFHEILFKDIRHELKATGCKKVIFFQKKNGKNTFEQFFNQNHPVNMQYKNKRSDFVNILPSPFAKKCRKSHNKTL